MRTIVITGYGINADRELAEAFRLAGGEPVAVHIADLLEDPLLLTTCEILAFPGGFSFGGYIGAGKVLASLLKDRMKNELQAFVRDGKLILGVCDGFQVLVKMGILPNLGKDLTQEASLIHNDSGLFTDRWVGIRFNTANPSPWIRGLQPTMYPVIHGEGRFITSSPKVAKALADKNLAAMFYEDNPNGSENAIAGITDETGRVLGMMPRPEAFLFTENHPFRDSSVRTGRALFENAVAFVKNGGV